MTRFGKCIRLVVVVLVVFCLWCSVFSNVVFCVTYTCKGQESDSVGNDVMSSPNFDSTGVLESCATI
jgi:hypothetical protein